MRRVILFPGMGGDRRLCEPVRTAGAGFVTPDHEQPRPKETLKEFAGRLAERHGVGPEDVVGGVSFGGMIAGEIARQRKVKGLVLLGSCLDPRGRLPASYRWLQAAGPLIPDFALGIRSWGPVMRSRFAPITDEAEAILRDMVEKCPPSQIREFGRMLFEWEGAKPSCPVLAVHGDMDRIIPPDAAEPGVTLKDAGHAFTLTHADETAKHLASFLAGL